MPTRSRIDQLISDYRLLASEMPATVKLVRETEIIEEVFHSNAIENSTLTISETERILLDMDLETAHSTRELFEAKNLYRVYQYIEKENPDLDLDTIRLCHRFLLENIDPDIAGRFRQDDEIVGVGSHIAPPPVVMDYQLQELFKSPVDTIGDVTRFHIEFEAIHPFVDGNGRIGRVIVNWQLKRLGLPPIVVRAETKTRDYYPHLGERNPNALEKVWVRYLAESLHKRIAYLSHMEIMTLADYSRSNDAGSLNSLLNKARRQTIPAFRLKNVWHIGVEPT